MHVGHRSGIVLPGLYFLLEGNPVASGNDICGDCYDRHVNDADCMVAFSCAWSRFQSSSNALIVNGDLDVGNREIKCA